MISEGPSRDRPFALSKIESLTIAVFLVLFFVSDHIVAYWVEIILTGSRDAKAIRPETQGVVRLALPLILALSAPRRSGLVIGNLRPHAKKILLLVGPLLIVGVAARYLFKEVNPYPDANLVFVAGVAPLREELLFSGFLYGFLRLSFPGSIKLGVSFDHALLLTAVLFSLHHLINLFVIPASWVLFQLLYTFIFMAVVGLTRQWTGSILYIWIVHAVGNFIMGYPVG